MGEGGWWVGEGGWWVGEGGWWVGGWVEVGAHTPTNPPLPPQAVRGNVKDRLEDKDQRGEAATLASELDLEQVGGCVWVGGGWGRGGRGEAATWQQAQQSSYYFDRSLLRQEIHL